MAAPDTKDSKSQLLQGPISLTHHISTEYNKNVYVFGEIHDITMVCLDRKDSMPISQYLNQVIKGNPNIMIDIFLELPFKKYTSMDILMREYDKRHPKIKEYQGELRELNTLFEACNKRLKDKCSYNVRVHLTDVREDAVPEIEHMSHLYNHVIDILYDGKLLLMKGIQEDLNVQFSIIDEFLHNILTNNNMPTLQDFKDKTRIAKNLANIVDNKIRETISSYFDNKLKSIQLNTKTFEDLNKLYRKYVTFLSSVTLTELQESKTNIEKFQHIWYQLHKIQDKIADYCVLLMDYYTITRIFRSYKPKQTGEYTLPAKDIIIYVGDAHARNYREFFKYMEFQQREEVYSSKYIPNVGNVSNSREVYSCLDVSKIKQPFFS